MMNNDNLNHFYKATLVSCNENNPAAFNNCWHFISLCIMLAFNITSQSDSDNYNVNLINNYINNDDIKRDLHFIRRTRNIYEHGDILSITMDQIKSIEPLLNNFINFINTVDPQKFQFARKPQFEEDTIVVDIRLCNNIEVSPKYPNTVYNYGYNQKDTYFVVNKYISESISASYAVIHNMLIRSDSVNISKYLSSIELSIKEKDIVFKYQIMLLLSICSNISEFSIEVNNNSKKYLNYALNDICYYCDIINNISDSNIIVSATIKTNNYIDNNTLIINNSSISCEDIEEKDLSMYSYNAHVLLSQNNIYYNISESNINYFNLLINELFGIETLRIGQIKALQKIFLNMNSIMVILPTGYGKSLLYQLCALLIPKITFVVSPDEFLINDQIENLIDSNISRVSLIQKTNQDKTIIKRVTKLPMFKSTINYITSETLLSENILDITDYLNSNKYLWNISIDECHKTSIWGHQFNIQYFTLIKQLIDTLTGVKLLLLSATVSKKVKGEISSQIYGLEIIQPCPLFRTDIIYDFVECNNFREICDYIESKLNRGSNDPNIPSLSIIINNNADILNAIKTDLVSRENFKNKCCLFDGNKNLYRRFRLGGKPILLTPDRYLTGINVPFLSNLFIIGMPINKEWFYQQTGRVGRYKANGFVSVILHKEDNEFIESLLSNQNPNNITQNPDIINHTNLYEGIYSNFNNHNNIIKNTYEMYVDITKKVYVSSSEKYGRVIGKMDSQIAKSYEFPIYLLQFLDIVKKYLYAYTDNEQMSYRFYINMDINYGTMTFENVLKKHVIQDSYDDQSKTKYLDMIDEVNEEFLSLIGIAYNWLNENSIKLKTAMFFNAYQLITQNIGVHDNNLIEHDLTNYFGVDSTISENLLEIPNYDHPEDEILERIKKSIQLFKTDIINRNNKLKAEAKPSMEMQDLKLYDKFSNKPSALDDITYNGNLKNEEILELTENSDLAISKNEEASDDSSYIGVDTSSILLERNEVTQLENEKILELTENSDLAISKNEEASDDSSYIDIDTSSILLEIKETKNPEYILENNVDTVSLPIIDPTPMSDITKKTQKIQPEDVRLDYNSLEPIILNSQYKQLLLNSEGDLRSMFINVNSDIQNQLFKFKAFLEREIEDQLNLNTLIGLTMYEVLNQNSKIFNRSKQLINMDKKIYIEILDVLKENLLPSRKIQIDLLLKEKDISEFYYPSKYYQILESNVDLIPNVFSIVEEDIQKSLYNYKSFLEILVEYHNHINCVMGLAMYELLNPYSKTLQRFEELLNCFNYVEVLDAIKKYLLPSKRLEVDIVLKGKNKPRYFYKGFIGFVMRIFIGK